MANKRAHMVTKTTKCRHEKYTRNMEFVCLTLVMFYTLLATPSGFSLYLRGSVTFQVIRVNYVDITIYTPFVCKKLKTTPLIHSHSPHAFIPTNAIKARHQTTNHLPIIDSTTQHLNRHILSSKPMIIFFKLRRSGPIPFHPSQGARPFKEGRRARKNIHSHEKLTILSCES